MACAEYRAYGLVPNFILERLAQEFKGQSELDRPTFNAKIREAYPTEQEVSGYTQRWGVVQAVHVLEELKSHQKQDANQAFYAALMQQYEQIYSTQNKPAMERACKKYWKLKRHFSEALADLLSFRGQSRLNCLLICGRRELRRASRSDVRNLSPPIPLRMDLKSGWVG